MSSRKLEEICKEAVLDYLPPFCNGRLTYHPWFVQAFKRQMLKKFTSEEFIRYAAIHYDPLLVEHVKFVYVEDGQQEEDIECDEGYQNFEDDKREEEADYKEEKQEYEEFQIKEDWHTEVEK